MAPSSRRRPTRPNILPLRQTSFRVAPTDTPPSAADTSTNGKTLSLTNRRAQKRQTRILRQIVRQSTGSLSSDRLDLTLPVPPSINHQYATVNGRRILSATGRLYKTQVAHSILITLSQTRDRHKFLRTLQSSFLGLSIRFHFPTPLRRDVDGGLKITQDAVCEALGINDNRILHIHLYKALDGTHPRIEVSLFRSSPEGSDLLSHKPHFPQA